MIPEYKVVFVIFVAGYTIFTFLGGSLAHAQSQHNIQINFGSSSPANFQFFTPSYLVVNRGAQVTWTNNDVVIHSINLIDPNLRVNVDHPPSDIVDPNSSIRYTFREPGVYDYYCALYPFMTGRIVVN